MEIEVAKGRRMVVVWKVGVLKGGWWLRPRVVMERRWMGFSRCWKVLDGLGRYWLIQEGFVWFCKVLDGFGRYDKV